MSGITKVLSIKSGGATAFRCHGRRWMVGKEANRAAVHGTKLPVPNAIPIKEVEMEIQKAIEVRERKRKEIEDELIQSSRNGPCSTLIKWCAPSNEYTRMYGISCL